MVNKLVRDGKVAVILSNLGWSTMARGDAAQERLFCVELALLLLNNASEREIEITYKRLQHRLEGEYHPNDLRVEWVPLGKMFRVLNDDCRGDEYLDIFDESHYLVA